ncbi:unnamed protein product [Spirodela intermedia]|uniref:Uncharacterized protein n=1 Tax=Spirodela intermedia TaxID=51605 RepID=A0A7I8KKX8_SPIIN|nr:unnamed protein product [Spirodela intermedia]
MNFCQLQNLLKIPNLSAYYPTSGRKPQHMCGIRSSMDEHTTRLRCYCFSSLSILPEEVNDLGVKVALSMLKFYKREISPLLPSSCRYVPTCSEYSMQAYKKYGVAKGTILTAWRLCRCNPLGGSGFDPPRWFDEETPTDPQP